MPTLEEMTEFERLLETAKVPANSSRYRVAMDKFTSSFTSSDGARPGPDDVRSNVRSKGCEREARSYWIEAALNPWCARHGITQKQALSIVFNDKPLVSALNPAKRLPTLRDVLAYGAQHEEFPASLMREILASERIGLLQSYIPAAVEYGPSHPTRGGVLRRVTCQAHSGWIWHDEAKKIYSFYAELENYIQDIKPVCMWLRKDERPYDFNAEVVEAWLIGDESASSPAIEKIVELLTNDVAVKSMALDKKATRFELEFPQEMSKHVFLALTRNLQKAGNAQNEVVRLLSESRWSLHPVMGCVLTPRASAASAI
jgi:hypothetical protein